MTCTDYMDRWLTARSKFDMAYQLRRVKTMTILYLMVGYVFLVSKALAPMGCAKPCDSCPSVMNAEQSIEVRSKNPFAHASMHPIISGLSGYFLIWVLPADSATGARDLETSA
jgi:hypothetical protein